MESEIKTPQDQVSLAAELLKNLLRLNGLEYEQIIADEQIEAALKNAVLEIKSMTLVDLIFTLQYAFVELASNSKTLALNNKLLGRNLEYLEKDVAIGEMVRSEPDKDKAYRLAARKKGWTQGKRTPDHNLLQEYLDLIGRDRLPVERTPKGKQEAIEFLTKKHHIQSIDATYQRLKRAQKKEKSVKKERNKDFSHLINILPGNWPVV